MIPYDKGEDPPLVTMKCMVSNPVTGAKSKEVTGKLDTGAATTSIPKEWATTLDLKPIRPITLIDYRGDGEEHWTYYVNVHLDGFKFDLIEAAAVTRGNVLIGRDVLNQLNIFLYGKALEFEVAKP
jgi:predicted aspartyl protease